MADYFSRAVLVGYIHGVAVVLMVGQLGKIFGLSIAADEALPQLAEVLSELGDSHGLTVLIGSTSLAALLLLRWRMPRIPVALLVVISGIGVSAVADLDDRGIAVIGDIPSGLPSLTWPWLGLGDVLALVPAAIGIFLVSFADGILTARSFAGQHGQRVDADQELVAFAAANLSAGATQGFPVGASGSRTAVNDQMGGRTQAVGSIAALIVAVVLLFLTAPVELLPTACLGAVIDATGAQALTELHASLEQDGIRLAVARLKQPVRAVFDASGLTATIGPEQFHPTVRAAVDAYTTVPDPDG